jgi:hypothetical protein
MDPITLILTALAAGAALGVKDTQLVAAAQALLCLVDAGGSRADTYNVTVTDSQGVQAGDHNVQHNTFGPQPGH